jgi:hypothetical protein
VCQENLFYFITINKSHLFFIKKLKSRHPEKAAGSAGVSGMHGIFSFDAVAKYA